MSNVLQILQNVNLTEAVKIRNTSVQMKKKATKNILEAREIVRIIQIDAFTITR